jgi:hypothetical protein
MSSITEITDYVREERHLTPGITRRAFNAVSDKFSIRDLLIRGRVHAVLDRGAGINANFQE